MKIYNAGNFFQFYAVIYIFCISAQMMEKKARECKSWKLRALKAEKELKLISSSLTRSQLEELQRQNVVLQCGESSLRSDRNDDSSLESCSATGNARDSERHLERATGHKEQHKVSEENVHTNLGGH